MLKIVEKKLASLTVYTT